MDIVVNGEERHFEGEITLSMLINELKIEDKVMASAVNMEIVKKDEWRNFILKDGDKVELLHFVGGG